MKLETKANGDSRSTIHGEGVLPWLVVGCLVPLFWLTRALLGIPYQEWRLPIVETVANGDSRSPVPYMRKGSLVGRRALGTTASLLAHPGPTRYGIPYRTESGGLSQPVLRIRIH